MQSPDLQVLIKKSLTVLDQLQAWLPPAPPATDWSAMAYRWQREGANAWLEAIHRIAPIALDDLQHVGAQKASLERNTLAFLQDKPANNVLMTGARGTGKSSLVRALLANYSRDGLRLIEVDKSDLKDLGKIMALIEARAEKFIIFCDDLSFEEGEASYKALKSALDGSVAAPGDNVLIYATSNRRHLMPEYMHENLQAQHQADGEIHPGESVEEKISLSERFGLWLSFYPFSQNDYLDIIEHWLQKHGCKPEQISAARTEALQWALQRGSRSGRVARQFARDWAARHA